jgi:uncharacterized protein YaeQ
MAQKATIYKASVQLSDLDHNYYPALSLTLAKHPSETDQRMMLRLATFLIHGWQQPEFCKGISTEDEPDLWVKTDGGEISLWLELGLPDEKRIRKACGRAQHVTVYAYGLRNAPVWREQNQDQWRRFERLQVSYFSPESCAQLEQLTSRNMQLQATLQDGELWLGDEQLTVHLAPEHWHSAKE